MQTEILTNLVGGLQFEHYRDHAVLTAICCTPDHTTYLELYETARPLGGFPSKRSTAGCVVRLAERGLVVLDINDKVVQTTSCHPKILIKPSALGMMKQQGVPMGTIKRQIRQGGETMSLDNPTPEMWDRAAKAAREMYHNKFVDPQLEMLTVEYKLANPIETQTFGPSEGEKVTSANPKQAYGDKKVPLHLVPGSASAYIAQGLKEGARKYGAFNWRETNVESMTYVGAALRHIAAYVDGETTDPESGNPHLAHAMASLAILVDAIESDKIIDNRPTSGPAAETLDRFTK